MKKWRILCYRPGKDRPISGGTFSDEVTAATRIAELRKVLPAWRFEMKEI